MTEHSLAINRPGQYARLFQIRKGNMVVAYLAILLIPFLATLSLNLDDKGLYSAVLGFLNVGCHDGVLYSVSTGGTS